MTEPAQTPGWTDVALAIPVRAGRILVTQRSGGHLAGCWEFPGGKVEAGEDPAAAARRELREETALAASELEHLMLLVHEYAGGPLRFHVFVAREPAGEVRVDGEREWSWMTYDELRSAKLPPANAPMVRALRRRLAR